MDLINRTPTHDFPARPRLAASRSPSRSPSRRQQFTNLDFNPSLSDLSPSSTLEALQANDIVRTEDKAGKSFIQKSVVSASRSERAWGIKAAWTGKKVQEWYAEIGGWAWPGFDQPPLEEPTRRKALYHIDRSSSIETMISNETPSVGKPNEGGLSAKLIQEYEGRIELIRDDMEALELEDLKNYVRSTHFKAGSRRSSLQNTQTDFALPKDYDQLDDFTAVITATIVQALPIISRLEMLLNTWSIRLLVLRQVPSFLIELDAGRESMISATIAIGAHDAQHTKRKPDFSQNAYLDIRAVLQDQIAELGRQLDRMLDLLEGSVDTLPDAWVDGLDSLENQYSAWVVKAERLAMNKKMNNGRLEKDYTQDPTDEILDLERPLDLRHTTSTLDIGAQLDEIRQRADHDFDLTRQISRESVKFENVVPEPSPKGSAGPFDLEPVPLRGALSERYLSNGAHSREPEIDSVDDQSSNGLSDGLNRPSLPSKSSHRPTPLSLAYSKANAKRPESPESASGTSGSGSATSNYSSNKSSSEIQSAVVAEYVGSPSKASSPTSLNREPMTPLDISFRKPGQWTDGDGTGIHPIGESSDLVSKNKRRSGGSGHIRTRSASLQSFEIVPKHEIRRIQVQRSGSYSSALSLSDPEHGKVQLDRFRSSIAQNGEPDASCTTTPLPHSKNVQNQQSSTTAQKLDSGLGMRRPQPLYHPPPPVPLSSSMLAQSSDQGLHTPKKQLPYHAPPAVPPRPAHPTKSLDREFDMAEHRNPYHSPPPVPSRSAHRFEQVSDLGPGSTPVNIRQMQVSGPTSGHTVGHVETPRTTVGLPQSNFDDQLEERISSILTELPTQIRLTSGPEPDAPEVTRNSPSDLRTPKIRLPAWRLKRTQTSALLPSMTLAPAQPKSSQSRPPTGEPGIKLYHLHQTGKTAPIKLFVRLVGEGGERVMVRIGGGWADLGEYLREYAGHHGRRSVSDSPFDITGFPSSSSPLSNNQSPRSRPGSRAASPTSSAMKQRPADRLARQHTSPAIFDSPHTPQSDPLSRTSQPLSWTGTDEASPSLGLAGPKTKNVDISPSRQAWVDEMMELARHSGADKKGGSESVVGDLGKVGNTKRVFFRSKREG